MSNPECLFCKIALGTIPSSQVFADEVMVAFRDIHPKAPTHMLIIPRKHIPSIAELELGDQALAAKMIERARLIAQAEGIAETGYRLVFNVRNHGGQEVDHLHLHLMGGKPLGPMA